MTAATHQVVATGSRSAWHGATGQTAVNRQGQTIPVTLCGRKVVAAYIPQDAVVTCVHCLRKLEV